MRDRGGNAHACRGAAATRNVIASIKPGSSSSIRNTTVSIEKADVRDVIFWVLMLKLCALLILVRRIVLMCLWGSPELHPSVYSCRKST
jgi:hypothetical protein